MGVDVDEPRGDHEAGGVHALAGRRIAQCAARRDRGDAVAADAEIAVVPRSAGAVHDPSVQDDDVESSVLRPGAGPPACRAAGQQECDDERACRRTVFSHHGSAP